METATIPDLLSSALRGTRKAVDDLRHQRLPADRIGAVDVNAQLLGSFAPDGMRSEGDALVRHAALRGVQNGQIP